jgi:hypothetical protein
MSVGRAVLAVGLFLDVLGTLFISWDVRKGQDATKLTVSVLQHLIRLGDHDDTNKIQARNAEATLAEIRRLDPTGTNQQLASTRAEMEEWLERWKIISEAEPLAREKTNAQVDSISNELVARKKLIYVAIALVFLGGVLEFIAGVGLSA